MHKKGQRWISSAYIIYEYMYNPLNRLRVEYPAPQTTFRIRMLSPKQLLVVASVSLLLIGVGIGFLIGFYTSKSGSGSEPQRNEGALPGSSVSSGLIREINPGNIKKHLHYLTSRPRVAGTEGEHEAVEYIASFWKGIGLVDVKVVPYEVMLSYPDPGFPSRVMIINGLNGEPVFTTRSVEKDLFAEGADRSGNMPPFNAYSASGSPEVYTIHTWVFSV